MYACTLHLAQKHKTPYRYDTNIDKPVLFSGILGGHPLAPKAYSGAIRKRDSSPRRIVPTASSNPGIKLPAQHQGLDMCVS